MKLAIKQKRYLNGSSVLFQAVILLCLGITLMMYKNIVMDIFAFLISIMLFMHSSNLILHNLLSKSIKVKIINIIPITLTYIFAFYFLKETESFTNLSSLIFSIYILLLGIIKCVTAIIYYHNKIKGRYIIFIQAIFSFAFAIALFTSKTFRNDLTITIIGIYFITLSLTCFLDAIDILIPIQTFNKIKRKTRITLPVFIAAFVPNKVLKGINKVFKSPTYQALNNAAHYTSQSKVDIEPDIEVLIHISPTGGGTFGHVDLFFDGKVLSYGSYDITNSIFATAIGDGVFFEIPNKDKYLNLCHIYSNKTIVSFGIKLTELEIEKIREKILSIKSNTYNWYPLCVTDKSSKIHTDYASLLYQEADAKMHKFKSGKFKTYFVFGTNCVMLADQIIGSSGIDILKMSGIICPGSYYEYFNRQFKLSKSSVVRKTIYTKN